MSDLATYDQAIRHLYSGLEKLKDEVDTQQIAIGRIRRPWYREPSVIIATLAFLFSLGTTVFAYIQTQQQRVHDLRTEARAALLQFNQLAIDTVKAQKEYRSDPNFASLLADKAGGTLAMLAVRVSELAMEISDHVSVREHLSIAGALHSADRSNIASRHASLALGRTTDPQERVDALRMLGLLAYGDRDLSAMRDRFQEAISAAEAITPRYLGHWSKLNTLQLWSGRELVVRECSAFGRLVKSIEEEYMKLPSDLQLNKSGELGVLRSQQCTS